MRRASRRAEGLLSLLTDPIDAELIAARPSLRAISNYAVGVDNVDVEAATARGIPVGHTPDVLTDSTADLAVALMLAIARRLAEGERIVRAGEWGTWAPTWLLGRDLHGATVAIVGGGRIGPRSRGGWRASAASCRRRRARRARLAEALGGGRLRHPAHAAHPADPRPDRRGASCGR